MLLKDYIIGGEQSGHIIFKELATTGDGELTALQILNIINEENKSLKECSKIMKKYPQVSKNIKVKNEDKKELFTNDEINNIINKYTIYIINLLLEILLYHKENLKYLVYVYLKILLLYFLILRLY